jgi:uncharacterized protein YbjT (DUF2867 family)
MLSLLPLVFAVALAAPPVSMDAALTSPMRHVRTTNGYLQRLLRTGAGHSYTFRSLLARLERSDVIVYVEPGVTLPRHLSGRLQLVTSSSRQRYVRAEVTMDATPNEIIALIAHELQHATELAAAPDVRDESSFGRLFQRIGHRGATDFEFETWAALDIGRAVKKELNV